MSRWKCFALWFDPLCGSRLQKALWLVMADPD